MNKNIHVRVKPQFCLFFLLILLQLISSRAFAQPANDDCNAATLLTSAINCNTVTGTVVNATNSGVAVGTCTGNPNDDVWYRFVAVSLEQDITISAVGGNLTSSGPRIQVFSGTCGALTPVTGGCGTTVVNLTGLAQGFTYYVRVYSAGAAAITTNGGFSICVTHDNIMDLGKSYVNISKPTSGTVETNDILEIRASIVVRAGRYDSCRFTDVIPAGTTYIPNTLSVQTNEAKIYKSFTDLRYDAANDAGYITGSTVTINLGYNPADVGSNANRRGTIRNTHKPNFSSSCILIATYRVTVTAAIGTQINTGGGTIQYSIATPAISTFTFAPNLVAVYTNYGMCANAIGANSLGTEFNGTFGTGTAKDRGPSANVPVSYTYLPFSASGPNDYYYGVSNNTSTGGAGFSTVNTWAKPDNSASTHRVFRYWDILGDHTGAVNPIVGNPPAALNANGGYMLIVNAAYRIDTAFSQLITGLCPNTYYEIACWMRNICSKCGTDSNGVGATGAAYIATGLGDSSGVKPNLTFEVNGVDYYTTGNIDYNGQWIKRGFTYLTGATQNSFTLKFNNNAPGGGGNDWALDDISVATCLPNMKYSPTLAPNVCTGNPLVIQDTVRSFFSNYVHYKWQRSTDGGLNWTDVAGTTFGPVPAGPSWPNLHKEGTDWAYLAQYTIPASQTTMANAGNKYRLVVATTATNLSDANCRSTDVGNVITLNVINCGPVLSVNIISFNGNTDTKKATLKWTTVGEYEALFFDIEKSYDGTNFNTIATINNEENYNGEKDFYSFTDPEEITGKAHYRIKMRSPDNRIAYSRILQLSVATTVFDFGTVINPFTSTLYFDIAVPQAGLIKAELIDQFGKPVRRKSIDAKEGVSQFFFENTGSLPTGFYILKAELAGMTVYRKVLKRN